MNIERRKKILSLLLAGVLTLSAAGCSKKDKKSGIKVEDNKIEININTPYDSFYNMHKKDNKDTSYDYLVDNEKIDSNIKNYTLGSIIDEQHYSSEISNGKYETRSLGTFLNNYGLVTLPYDYRYYNLDDIKKFTDSKIYDDIYKFKTLDNNLYYYLEQRIDIGKRINDYNDRLFGTLSDMKDKEMLKEGDYFQTQTLLKYDKETKEINVVAHKQNGAGSNNENVLANNIGTIDDIITNIEDTELKDLSGSELLPQQVSEILYNLKYDKKNLTLK